jgi:hypothetical protein
MLSFGTINIHEAVVGERVLIQSMDPIVPEILPDVNSLIDAVNLKICTYFYGRNHICTSIAGRKCGLRG